MKINRDNYEAYFLDYHEGALNPEEMAEVLVFVGQNPDLKEQFEEFENISLTAEESVSFSGKDFLKPGGTAFLGPITPGNIEEYLVAEVEGLLSTEMIARLDEFILQNPTFEKDRRIFSHTHLSADKQVVFRYKNSLRHEALPAGEITESTYGDYMVKEVEGILTPDETRDLNEFLALNPSFEKDRHIFGLTRLQADTSITFQGKASLRRTVVPLRRLVYYAMSAAASVVILLGLYFGLDLNRTSNQETLSNISFNQPVVIPDLPENDYHKADVSGQAVEDIDKGGGVSGHINDKEPVVSKHRNSVETIPARVQMPRMEMLAQQEVTSRHQVAPEFLFIRQSQLYGSRYIDLYNSVKLSEQIQYASINAQDKNPLSTLWRGLTGKVQDRIVDDRRTVTQQSPGLSIWTFAEAGVKAYNNISHDDLELMLQKDETGKVVSYALVGDRVNFERGVKQ